MGMNLDELEQQQSSKRPLDVTKQVFGAQDYRNADERYCACDGCSATRWAEPGTKCPCGGTRVLYSQRQKELQRLYDPRIEVIGATSKPCNVISGHWEMCERGTVGCTEHRRHTAAPKQYFPCHIKHHNRICMCSQPVIVDQVMLKNVESAALHVLGALKPDATNSRLDRDDLDYLAIHASRIMAHWARKALGHKPEDEKD